MLEQALRGEDVADFAGADAEGERSDRAVGARVAVAADHGHPGLGGAEFGPDHVDDAAALVSHRIERNAVAIAVRLQSVELGRSLGVEHPEPCVVDRRVGRRRVVHRRQGQVGPPNGQSPLGQGGERLRRCDFVDQVQVDEERRRQALLLGGDQVAPPDLLEQRPGRRGHHASTGCGLETESVEGPLSPAVYLVPIAVSIRFRAAR